LANEPTTQLTNDIHSMILIMYVNILVNQDEERYGEALDYAIYNLERLKKLNQNSNDPFAEEIMTRTYVILGFCYSKISDFTPYHEDKYQSIQLALACFKSVNEVTYV
jgi:hypothetical protein